MNNDLTKINLSTVLIKYNADLIDVNHSLIIQHVTLFCRLKNDDDEAN